MVYRAGRSSARVRVVDSLRDRVAGQLREQILSNTLPPGARLPERALSEQLGVSRVPVREALMVLETELLVTSTPRSGAEVSRFARRDAEELFDAREALEPLVARLAAQHRSPEQLRTLSTLLEEARDAGSRGDNRAGAVANAAFHSVLVAASGSALLVSIMAPMQVTIERLFRRTIVGRAPELSDDHARMLDALRRRDAESAGLLAQLHLTTTRAPSLALFEE